MIGIRKKIERKKEGIVSPSEVKGKSKSVSSQNVTSGVHIVVPILKKEVNVLVLYYSALMDNIIDGETHGRSSSQAKVEGRMTSL